MESDELVTAIRRESGLSLRALASAANVAASTLHRIEHGRIHPTLHTLRRIASTAGMTLHVEPRVDYTASMLGLAASLRDDTEQSDEAAVIRRAAEFAYRFRSADNDDRRRMIAAEPPFGIDPRWDAFVAALAEWLAATCGVATPAWTSHCRRYLQSGWWVSSMTSLRAWEYAGSPMAFKSRGIFLHRDSLLNV